MQYDRLVIATWSELKRLPVPGLDEYGWNIDNNESAVALDRHLSATIQMTYEQGYNTYVIIGAGFTGIELATEMRDRIAEHSNLQVAEQARIILVERADTIGPDMGVKPRPEIEAALREANVEVKLGLSIDNVTADSVTLSNGETIDTKTVITTAGLQANALDGTLPACIQH